MNGIEREHFHEQFVLESNWKIVERSNVNDFLDFTRL